MTTDQVLAGVSLSVVLAVGSPVLATRLREPLVLVKPTAGSVPRSPIASSREPGDMMVALGP